MSVFRRGLFDGRVAIVTGGGTGIGRSIATELLHLGCTVVIASRNAQRLRDAADEMRADGGRILAVPCNARRESDVKSLFETTLASYGRLDYVINNGGGQYVSASESITLKGWNAVIETNLQSTFLCCREAYASHMKANGGAIVNMAMNFYNGHPGFLHSSAARAGVDNLTKTLAVEWAASGVRVNCVAPGHVYSATAAANYDPGLFDAMKSKSPAKRLGTPEEVSSVICFLLSPAAAYVTGVTVPIDGGLRLYGSYVSLPDHDRMPVYSWQKAKL